MHEGLDPEVRRLVERWEAKGIPEWHTLSVESARALEDRLFSPESRPETVSVREFAIPGPRGPIPIRLYRPRDERARSTLVYYHGGGWVLGTLDSVESICLELASRTGRLVVSVDYRLAPEHPFPAPLDDAAAALAWVSENAASIGATLPVSVAGTSAGGNLAAAVALRAREFDGPEIHRQLLLYPITDHSSETGSYDDHAEGPLLTRSDMEWFWDSYLPSPVCGANPFASVLRTPDPTGLPPATVLTCGFDPLRDEGIAYADRLSEAGVPTTHLHYPGAVHGILSVTDEVALAEEAMAEVVSALDGASER